MAEIERWITVNGAHIPIMKGESKMAAIGRFIKGKKLERRTDLNDNKWRIAKKLDNAYSGNASPSERHRLEKEYEENENKLKQLNKRKEIKGYSTDPDRKEEKAQNAFKNTMKEYESDIKKAEADLDTFLRQDTYDMTKNMNKTERAVFENRRKQEEAQLRYYRDMAPLKAEERALRSYENVKMFTSSKKYKLKEDKETKTQKSERRFLGHGDLNNPNEYYGTHDRRRLITKSRSGKSTRGRARRY